MVTNFAITLSKTRKTALSWSEKFKTFIETIQCNGAPQVNDN